MENTIFDDGVIESILDRIIEEKKKNMGYNVPESEYSRKKEELIQSCQDEPKREKVFFYVFVPGSGEPKVKHSFQSAKLEAFRIAQKTGKEAFVLQAIKSYKVKDIVETNFMHEPEKLGKR